MIKYVKYWKEALILILVIIVSISTRTCTKRGDDISLLEQSRDSAYYQVAYYKNREGELIGQVKTFEVTTKQLKEHGDQLGFEVDGLKKQVVNLNRLVAHWQGKATIKDTFYTKGVDTVIVYKDKQEVAMVFTSRPSKFLELDQLYHPSDKTLSTVYQYDVDFSLTAYRKGKTFFKPGQLVTDIKFNDPQMKVTQFSGFVVKEDRPKLWERKWFIFTTGAVVGIATYKFISK